MGNLFRQIAGWKRLHSLKWDFLYKDFDRAVCNAANHLQDWRQVPQIAHLHFVGSEIIH